MRTPQHVVRTITIAIITVGLLSVTGGCSKKGPFERLGDKADQAVEDAGEAIEDAGDAVKDIAGDAADEVGKAADDAAEQSDEASPDAPEDTRSKAE